MIDEHVEKTAVVIDLKRHSDVWEDFVDVATARSRRDEPRETLAAMKRRLYRAGKLRRNTSPAR